MNTKQLEKFAQKARRQLHAQVEARLERVLTTDSAELRARAKAIDELNKQIRESSRAAVIEKVAYTWFNRFVALRYMDVNHYTRMGTVSPASGFTQPEILQEAKQGHVDDGLARFVDRDTVFGLLTGRLPSADPQQEAYRLLLVAACNFYHDGMPFMFEKIDDYTELLMPGDLLSAGSILQAVREALTPENCQDVEVIGWLYQFYISEKKDEVIGSKRKIEAGDIPAATQLFTPHWIVRYLVENSLGRLWLLNHPESRLVERMDYYIAPEQKESDFLRVASPEELTVCDPAAGSGHMLTYAFDLLHAIYEEQGYNAVDIPRLILEKNLYGMEIDERAGALAAFALMMKARSRDRRFFSREGKPNVITLRRVTFQEGELAGEPWLQELPGDQRERLLHDLYLFNEADNFGSLLQPQLTAREIATIWKQVQTEKVDGTLFAHERRQRVLRALLQAAYLARKYHVVVANPPYMGSRNVNARLKWLLKDEYKPYKSDLFSAFVVRCAQMTLMGGMTGIMSPNVWMYISSHKGLRRYLTTRRTLTSLVELPLSGFKGATVQLSAYTFVNSRSNTISAGFVRLVDFRGGDEEMARYTRRAVKDPDCGWYFQTHARKFSAIPGSPIAYWVSDKIRAIYRDSKPFHTVATPRAGMITGNNRQFVRLWHEVATDRIGFGYGDREVAKISGKRWFPYQR